MAASMNAAPIPAKVRVGGSGTEVILSGLNTATISSPLVDTETIPVMFTGPAGPAKRSRFIWDFPMFVGQ